MGLRRAMRVGQWGVNEGGGVGGSVAVRHGGTSQRTCGRDNISELSQNP